MPAAPLQVVTVTAVPTYPDHDSPQVKLKFTPEAYVMLNTSPTAVIAFSFDGVSDTWILNAGDSISWPSNDAQLWVRKVSGSGSATLQVSAAGKEQP